MKVLFDTNVVLDILTKRAGWSESALALAKTSAPWLSALSIANIACIIGRSKRDRLSGTIERLQERFAIAAFGASSVERALGLGWNDFEDAAQMAVAEENRIPWLVTHNLSHFESTRRVTVLSVTDLLEKWPGKNR